MKKKDGEEKGSWNDHGDMIIGDNVIKVSDNKALEIAALNYMELMREHHPFDFDPRAIYRVIVAKSGDAGVNHEIIKQFFLETVEENAGRACRGVPSLNYSECLSKWMSMAGPALVKALCNKTPIKNTKSFSGRGIKNPRAPGGPPLPNSKKARYPFCNQFNEETGCSNKKIGVDCCQAPNGRKYTHSCKVQVPPGSKNYCSAWKHNAFTHNSAN